MIIGLTRVRNEAAIIKDTLDHFGQWCDQIFVYDDASTDDTVEICEAHDKVAGIILGTVWSSDRLNAEHLHRQELLQFARKQSTPDWFIYFDADERIDWDFTGYEDYDAVRMKLFDFYITESDKDKPYSERQYLGPEYRQIIFMFRNRPDAGYWMPDQREVAFMEPVKILEAGFVKHYGKAISVEEWEKACDYYWRYFPEPYKTKWLLRKGKAVHTRSDFHRPLITWDEKESKGVPL